jgi:hypothetical protein
MNRPRHAIILTAALLLLSVSLRAGFLDALIGAPQLSDVYQSPDYPAIHASGARLAVLGLAVRESDDRIYREQQVEFGVLIARAIQHKNRTSRSRAPRECSVRLARPAWRTCLSFFSATATSTCPTWV